MPSRGPAQILKRAKAHVIVKDMSLADSSLFCFLYCKDYFFRPDSSLSCSFVPKGLFLPPGFILILLFCAIGIIFSARIHPYPALLCCR